MLGGPERKRGLTLVIQIVAHPVAVPVNWTTMAGGAAMQMGRRIKLGKNRPIPGASTICTGMSTNGVRTTRMTVSTAHLVPTMGVHGEFQRHLIGWSVAAAWPKLREPVTRLAAAATTRATGEMSLGFDWRVLNNSFRFPR